jgi:hypothetical protein
MGQEWTAPIDFRRITSTDTPSSGIFVFLAFVGCLLARVIHLSVNYLQNCWIDFNEILHTAYWTGVDASL